MAMLGLARIGCKVYWGNDRVGTAVRHIFRIAVNFTQSVEIYVFLLP